MMNLNSEILHRQYQVAKKSLYILGISCFKTSSLILNSVNSQTKYLKKSNNNRKQKRFYKKFFSMKYIYIVKKLKTKKIKDKY